ILASALKDKALERPSDDEVLKEQVLQVEAIAEAILNIVKVTYEVVATETRDPTVVVGVEKVVEATLYVTEVIDSKARKE
ncbi:hypothetical protein RYX36_013230, partial [Vicia faba]